MLIWERPEPAARSSLSPLSRDRIVRAAIGLADGDGLPAVSLRKVAAALDAGPMRLYRYVDTKEELLDLMVDAVYAEIPLPEPLEEGEGARRTGRTGRDAYGPSPTACAARHCATSGSPTSSAAARSSAPRPSAIWRRSWPPCAAPRASTRTTRTP